MLDQCYHILWNLVYHFERGDIDQQGAHGREDERKTH